jgi:hypothetical protein
MKESVTDALRPPLRHDSVRDVDQAVIPFFAREREKCVRSRVRLFWNLLRGGGSVAE